jgi:uncharacterized protein (TIGR02284 family)
MNTAEILNHLVADCIDSEKRYRHAAKDVERAALETFFNRQADSRKRFAAELERERTRLGIKDGKGSGTISGFIDRQALDFSVAMSKGDTGVVEWCREDDQAVIDAYQKALAQNPPAELRTTLERQLGEISAAVVKEEDVLRLFGGPKS